MEHRPRAAVALLILALAAYSGFWLARRSSARLLDWKSFYAAAAVAGTGEDFYDVKTLNRAARAKGVRGYVFPYLYPPVLAHLARPWGRAEPGQAAKLLILFNLVLLFPTLLLVAVDVRASVSRAFGGERADAAYVFAALSLLVLPWNDNVDMGQVNVLILFLLVLGLHFSRTRREALGGASLGLAALLKVAPLLLLFWFLARRRYRAVGACLLTMAGVAALTLAVGAGRDWLRFFALLPAMSYGSTIPGLFPPAFYPNLSFAGLFSRLLRNDPLSVRIITTVLVAGLLAALTALAARAARHRDGPAEELTLLPFLVLMILASPVAYRHHVVYLAPGLVLALSLAWAALSGWKRMGFVAFLLLAAAAAGAPFPDFYGRWGLSPLGARLLTSVNLYALVAVALAGLALRRLLPPEGPDQRS